MTTMPGSSSSVPAPPPATSAEPPVPRPARFWPAIILLAGFWGYQALSQSAEMATHVRFFSRIGVSVLLALGFAIWWFLNRRFGRRERFAWLAATLAVLIGVSFVCHPSFGVFGMLFFGLPVLLTVGTVWLMASRNQPLARQRMGLATLLVVVPASFALVRMDGLSGEQESLVRWRWKPTAEELYLAGRGRSAGTLQKTANGSIEANSDHSQPLALEPGDWPGFRGPAANGEVRGVRIATDWKSNPPRIVWRQRIGPAWSSMAVVGGRLFTQEQRGEAEAVICLDAATGREIWAHEDATRFWEAVSGAGPRATPAFADGRLYTLGAKGRLNCLDAATGRCVWSHNIADDSGAEVPLWAFSGSPLATRGMVVAFAGGQGEKQLLAYEAATGAPAWSVPAGQLSYSSPQLVSIDGMPQILILDDRGLVSVSPESGALLWEYSAPIPGAPRSVEASAVGPSQILIATEAGIGMVLLDVQRDDEKWSVSASETSNNFKPAFSDFVVHNGFVYGFDSAIFACADYRTGKRQWKQGRYGHGQVLLLADQELLLIQAESGEVVLLAANPERLEERGRFQAIDGKTWNHPAIVRGRLFVRNAEEIACYDLGTP
jgi:outer membrane protein assembly factor BamB